MSDAKKVNSSDYNVMQSKIAIGSGGFWGKGFLNGTSTKNDFVPEQNTDFIFCAIGEQFGFVGSLVLVGIVSFADAAHHIYCRAAAICIYPGIWLLCGLYTVLSLCDQYIYDHRSGTCDRYHPAVPSYGGSSLLSFSILIFILIRLMPTGRR